MAILRVNLTPGEFQNFDFRSTLDGVEYEFRFRFNRRDDRWYLSIFDNAGAPIRQGIAGVVNFDLVFRIADFRAPPGRLFLTDVRTPPAAPSQLELGDPVAFIYVDQESANAGSV